MSKYTAQTDSYLFASLDSQQLSISEKALSLLTAHGSDWQHFRKCVNPVLMSPHSMDVYFPSFSNLNMSFVNRIREIRDPITQEVPGNFYKDIYRSLLQSIVVVAMNKDLSDSEADELNDVLVDVLQHIFVIEYKPSLWKVFKTSEDKKYFDNLRKLHDLTSGFILNTIEHQNEDTILGKLLKVDEHVAVAMAIEMMLAGVNTIANSLAGILLCLAKNPEKQEILRNEVFSYLPEKHSQFSLEGSRNMPYLRACIKEGMRSYPIAIGHLRTTNKDMILEGYQIPKGSDIFLNFGDNLEDDHYFENSNMFLPERWINGNGYDKPDPFTFLPFSFGPRSCVGKRIANIQMEFYLSRVIRNFYVSFDYSTENAFVNYFSNYISIPLMFRFEDV
ncbi:hypothetical protein ACFFRR_002542 [Megaselia abdita]